MPKLAKLLAALEQEERQMELEMTRVKKAIRHLRECQAQLVKETAA